MSTTTKIFTDHIETLSAAELLAIPENEPEKLFKKGADDITSAYHKLAKLWFPDINKDPKAADVFRHVKALRDKANDKLTSGTWQEAGKFTCRLKDGREFQVRSDARFSFDLGTMHIAPSTITYVVAREHEDLFKNAVKQIKAIDFLDNHKKPDAKLKDVYEKSLPVIHKTYEGEDAFILTIKKRVEDVRLLDLLPHIPKDDFSKHAAWITSRLLEMARFLDHAGIAHNAISLDNVFVSPKDHAIGLFGGWWYASHFGAPLTAVPGEALDLLPDTNGKQPILADGKIDRELVRAAAREMLGDRNGTRLTTLKTAPQPMIDFLRTPSSGDAQKDLSQWHQSILKKSFGARRFTKLNIDYSDIYRPGGAS